MRASSFFTLLAFLLSLSSSLDVFGLNRLRLGGGKHNNRDRNNRKKKHGKAVDKAEENDGIINISNEDADELEEQSTTDEDHRSFALVQNVPLGELEILREMLHKQKDFQSNPKRISFELTA